MSDPTLPPSILGLPNLGPALGALSSGLPSGPMGASRTDESQPFLYDAVALTPEMILALVRRRLAGADDQITAIMDTIEQNNRRSELFAYRQQVIMALRQRAQGDHAGHPDRKFEVTEVLEGGTLEINGERKTLDEWMASAGLTPNDLGIDDDGKVSLNQLETALDKVKQDARTEASGSEMNMLQLQQLMQQRSQIIQLGTNLSKKIAEGESAIVNNLR